MNKTQRSIVSVGQKPQTKTKHAIRRFKKHMDKSRPHLHAATRAVFQMLKKHELFGVERGEMKTSEKDQYTQYLQYIRSLIRNIISQTYTAEIPQITNITSSGAGFVDVSLGWGTALSTASDFASFSAIFDEFRIRAVRLSVQPVNKYSKTTTLSRAIYYTHDNDGQAIVSAYDAIAQYPQHHESNTDDMFPKMNMWWTRPNLANSTLLGEMWTDMASASSAVGTTLIYSDGLSASVIYGLANLTLLVEFKLAR
jgi:hypothetical protein